MAQKGKLQEGHTEVSSSAVRAEQVGTRNRNPTAFAQVTFAHYFCMLQVFIFLCLQDMAEVCHISPFAI